MLLWLPVFWRTLLFLSSSQSASCLAPVCIILDYVLWLVEREANQNLDRFSRARFSPAFSEGTRWNSWLRQWKKKMGKLGLGKESFTLFPYRPCICCQNTEFLATLWPGNIYILIPGYCLVTLLWGWNQPRSQKWQIILSQCYIITWEWKHN